MCILLTSTVGTTYKLYRRFLHTTENNYGGKVQCEVFQATF
jgi:hypothetical protein